MTGRYSGTKILHFHDKLEDLMAGRHSAPLHVRLKPTNRCNHRCGYCCYRCPDLYLGERMDPGDEIPPAKMAEIVEDLVGMGVKAVTFSGGGEPLLYPAFVETARALADGGVKIAALTNGALLRGEAAELLGERASWVRVSMDAADPERYARSRGVSARALDEVCDNLRRFAAARAGACVLGVNYVVTPGNSGEIYRFLELMKGLGVDHVKVSEAVVSVRWRENRDYVATFHRVARQAIDRARERLEDPSFSVVDRLLDPGAPAGADPYRKAYSRCPFAACLTVIAADLSVYTCQDKAYTDGGWLGSLRDGRFRDVWLARETRARLAAVDPARVCGHHCVAHDKNLTLLDYLAADLDHLEFV